MDAGFWKNRRNKQNFKMQGSVKYQDFASFYIHGSARRMTAFVTNVVSLELYLIYFF